MVPAPGQHVHRQRGRIRQLQEEDLLRRGCPRWRPGRGPRDRMWKLSRQTPDTAGGRRARRSARRAGSRRRTCPRPAPRRRAGRRTRRPGRPARDSWSAETVVGVDRRGADVAADQHRIDAEPVHQRRTWPRPAAGWPPNTSLGRRPRRRGTADRGPGSVPADRPGHGSPRGSPRRRPDRARRSRRRRSRPPQQACSFSLRLPLRQTVATDVRIAAPSVPLRLMYQTVHYSVRTG